MDKESMSNPDEQFLQSGENVNKPVFKPDEHIQLSHPPLQKKIVGLYLGE